jgi:hypothetical protein
MPLYGNTPPQSIYPGQLGTMMGVRAIPGTPVAAANETFAGSAKSRPVVIAAQPGFHPSTQRQVTWRVFGSGSLDINLQASIDDKDANYVTVANYTGTGNSGSLIVQADIAAAAGPQAQSVAQIVSSARFWRVVNAGSSTSITADIVSQ